jgi:hypothetical protein
LEKFALNESMSSDIIKITGELIMEQEQKNESSEEIGQQPGLEVDPKLGLKLQLLSMSKDVLERNAALSWEQDKTKGLEITVEEIISSARKMMEFVLEN